MINKAVLLGRVGKDPDIKSSGRGVVARLSIATSESWMDKATGEKKERTEWHNVVAFEPLSNVIRDWVQKGSQLYIEGKLTTNKWTDQNGVDRYTTSIQAQTLKMIGGKPKNEGANQNQQKTPQANTFVDDEVPF